jgi:hypothetical protein
VTITRNGRDAAVLISAADLDALEETVSVLSDPPALADIREADAAYARGDVIRGSDAVPSAAVSGADDCALVVTSPAARAVSEQLPEGVAVAAIEFLTSTFDR